MAKASIEGVELAYERRGSGDPVVLIAGLSGQGRGWGEQVGLLADEFDLVVPDHPGTGNSSRPESYTLDHHARAMAGLIRTVVGEPCHIVGSSTGGAIAQLMALDHPDTVQSISLVSSWARADDHFRHQFAVRKDTLTALGSRAYADLSALFLFSAPYFRNNYVKVEGWCRLASGADPDVMAARIDMILDHDTLERLPAVQVPTLVLVGSDDACTPPHLSRELAEAIPGAEYAVLDGGHLIYKENVAGFHEAVSGFIRRH